MYPICLTLPELRSLPDVAWGSTIVRAMPFGRAGPFGFPAFGVRATGYLSVPMANKQRLRDLSEPCTSWLGGFLTYVSVASPINRRTHERRHHRTKNRTSAVRRRSPSTRYSNDAIMRTVPSSLTGIKGFSRGIVFPYRTVQALIKYGTPQGTGRRSKTTRPMEQGRTRKV